MIMSNLSSTELTQVVESLRQMEPGFLPLPLFLEVSRLSVSAIIELVPLRRVKEGTIEVLLFRREADDPMWPGLWANPGTVLRPTDTPGTFDDAFGRLYDDELGVGASRLAPTFVSNSLFKTERGLHFAAVHWLELAHSNSGTYFPVNDLPKDIVSAQVGVIQAAAKHFESQ